jgi:signal transduction histidine kinase/CheY-like chemotaxis protein
MSEPTDPPQDAASADDARLTIGTLSLGSLIGLSLPGMCVVSLVGLSVMPWPVVLIWTLISVVAVGATIGLHWMAARTNRLSRFGRAVTLETPVIATMVYAAAAIALVLKGDQNARLFALALCCASMLQLLMNYHSAMKRLAIGMAPFLLALAVLGYGLSGHALRQGHILSALAPAFAVMMIVTQFWMARLQLAQSWRELQTAREQAEERERSAEAANRAKSQFLANMSHELRTPLNGVLGMVQALTRDELTRAQEERVRIIRRSSENLLSVLNDLLDLSKIEASALDLEITEFDPEHLVRGVAAAYKPLAGKKGLSFDLDIAESAGERLLGDSARIRRVLYSLTDNAVKFTETGGVTLQVARDGGDAVFCVTDTGIGIAAENLEHLFEDFFQVDASLTRKYGGAGLGLAVCRHLATLMDGSVEVASRLGEGSTFTLRLPLKLAPAAPAPAPRPEREALHEQPQLRILAAEDNAANQMVLKALLEPLGVAPALVENGREAVAAWEGQAWDLILMDIQMPEMSGVEATRAIRRRETLTGRARTPIIAVTANAMTHQLAEYRAAGMDGVVAKPIELGNLIAVMEAALASANEAAEPERRAAGG